METLAPYIMKLLDFITVWHITLMEEKFDKSGLEKC